MFGCLRQEMGLNPQFSLVFDSLRKYNVLVRYMFLKGDLVKVTSFCFPCFVFLGNTRTKMLVKVTCKVSYLNIFTHVKLELLIS